MSEVTAGQPGGGPALEGEGGSRGREEAHFKHDTDAFVRRAALRLTGATLQQHRRRNNGGWIKEERRRSGGKKRHVKDKHSRRLKRPDASANHQNGDAEEEGWNFQTGTRRPDEIAAEKATSEQKNGEDDADEETRLIRRS